MNVLITGGTGFIGRRLAALLTDAGHTVSVLTRRRLPPVGWPAQVKLVHWNGPSAGFPSEALTGIEAVINLAGEPIAGGRWSRSRKERIFHSRVTTTRQLVSAMAHLDPKPLVLISASAVGYYGPHRDDTLTEAAPPGEDFLAVVCSHWEDEARKVVRQGVRLVLLRIGIVLGADGGALPRMMFPFKLFAGGPAGSGTQPMSWIHCDDLIRMIRYALENTEVSGPLNGTAPGPLTNREFNRLLGQVMKRPSFLHVPGWLLRLTLGEMADLILTGQRVIPQRALEYGFVFRYPEITAALRALL